MTGKGCAPALAVATLHVLQHGYCDCCPARMLWQFFGQIAVGFDEKTFPYDTFVLFERAFDPIHVFAVSIWHRGNYPVIAGSRAAKKPVRNAGHQLTNVE
jgi:hypothetical protein